MLKKKLENVDFHFSPKKSNAGKKTTSTQMIYNIFFIGNYTNNQGVLNTRTPPCSYKSSLAWSTIKKLASTENLTSENI